MSPPVGAQEQEQLLCIIMEYAEGGTLGDVISAHASRAEPFAEPIVLRWAHQLAGALQHLHSHRVLHRDLKAQNVLLTLTKSKLLLVGSNTPTPSESNGANTTFPLSAVAAPLNL